MFAETALVLSALQIYWVAAQGECTDFRGRLISHGLHYVPGPDTCTLCVCDNGLPKVCKAVLCSPPQDCRSFRVGNTCCEFICLDDVVKPADGAEANVRVAAGGAAGVVLLTVALVVYRVRKQKRRRPPHADDQRSLTSIGYISGSMGYMGGTCETALAAWKPPGNYLPRGEAPPPYDEAISQCRPEAMRLNSETGYHRTYSTTMDNLPRPGEEIQCVGHGYVNIPRPMQQMANTQNCYNAPLLQPVHPPEARDPIIPHHPLTASVVGYPSAVRLTGSLGTISARAVGALVVPRDDHERPHNVPGFYTNTVHTSLHRTIPRISTAVEPSLEAMGQPFSRAERSLGLAGEVRRSFHRPEPPRADRTPRDVRDAGRSVPRNLNIASFANSDVRAFQLVDDSASIRAGRSRAHSEEHNVGSEQKISKPPEPAPNPPSSTLPLTVDKPSCVCSYEGSSAPGAEDADDYRSECENCKSASSSRWVLEEGWVEEAADGTQTLQRHAPPPAAPPPATATLPQPVTRPSRTSMVPPSNWENWFNTIIDSDSESEEE